MRLRPHLSLASLELLRRHELLRYGRMRHHLAHPHSQLPLRQHDTLRLQIKLPRFARVCVVNALLIDAILFALRARVCSLNNRSKLLKSRCFATNSCLMSAHSARIGFESTRSRRNRRRQSASSFAFENMLDKTRAICYNKYL